MLLYATCFTTNTTICSGRYHPLPCTPKSFPTLCQDGILVLSASHTTKTQAYLNRTIDDNTPGNSAGIHACALDIHRHLPAPETQGGQDGVMILQPNWGVVTQPAVSCVERQHSSCSHDQHTAFVGCLTTKSSVLWVLKRNNTRRKPRSLDRHATDLKR